MKFLNREVAAKHTFRVDGTFESMYAVEKYLEGLGYKIGSSCALKPTAFVKGNYNLPNKWKNMSASERKSVDGVMVGDMREGPVDVYIFNL